MVEKSLICANREDSEFNNRMKGIAHSNIYSCVYNKPQGFLQVEHERLLMVCEWYGTTVLFKLEKLDTMMKHCFWHVLVFLSH